MSMSRSLPGCRLAPRYGAEDCGMAHTTRMQLSLVLLQGSEGFVSGHVTVYRKTATLTSFHSFRATSNPVALLSSNISALRCWNL